MRWFKHFSDNHRGKTTQHLLDELGYFGPFFVQTLMEMCAEKLEPKVGKALSEDDCLFQFHERVLCSVMRARSTGVRRALDFCATCGFLQWSSDGKQIKISMPILLDLLEYDQKKFRPRRATIAPRSRVEEDTDTEEDADSSREIPKPENRESGSDAATASKKSGKHPRLMAIASNSVSNFEARFKTYEDPRRIEFMQTIAILAKAIPPISGVFNRERFLVDAMQVFPTAEEFDAFAQGLIDSVKTARPKDVRAYASAIWREHVSRNRDNPPLELPSLEGIDGV